MWPAPTAHHGESVIVPIYASWVCLCLCDSCLRGREKGDRMLLPLHPSVTVCSWLCESSCVCVCVCEVQVLGGRYMYTPNGMEEHLDMGECRWGQSRSPGCSSVEWPTLGFRSGNDLTVVRNPCTVPCSMGYLLEILCLCPSPNLHTLVCVH